MKGGAKGKNKLNELNHLKCKILIKLGHINQIANNRPSEFLYTLILKEWSGQHCQSQIYIYSTYLNKDVNINEPHTSNA